MNAVPAPGATTSIVTVKVGGDRNGITGVTALQGVTLGLYAAQTGGSALFTCLSDVDGDCNFTVTGTGTTCPTPTATAVLGASTNGSRSGRLVREPDAPHR